METTRPVFVVGIARSGTSIVYRTLQHHPSFRPANAPDGFDLTESRAFVDPSGLRTRTGPAFRFMLGDEGRHRAFLASVESIPAALAGLQANRSVRRVLDRSPRARVAWWKSCRNHHLLRLFFAHAAPARGVVRIVEKTPAHLGFLPEILATFPHAKLLCLHRHPLEVFSSYRRRLAVAERLPDVPQATRNWLRMSAEVFCRAYREEVWTILRASAKRPAAVLPIRYADFTGDPRRAFREIFEFVGEPFDADVLERGAPALASWTQDPLLAQPVTRNEKDWRSYLDESTAAAIETRLADVMDEIGYRRSSDGRPERAP